MEYQHYVGNGTTAREARRIVEEVIGKPLPLGAEVHHINGDSTNNSNSNLVACEDESYHKLLHRRTNALIACGNVHWRICKFCGEHDDPKNLYIHPNGKSAHHRECRREYQRERLRSEQIRN